MTRWWHAKWNSKSGNIVSPLHIQVRRLPQFHQGRCFKASGLYAGLKDADLADIIAHLRTVPPLQ
jgi:hypothetical protein